MQDKITNTMSIENGKYIYNKKEIRSIINEYDFTNINNILNRNWTNDSFFEEAISMIDRYRADTGVSSKSCTARASSMCGQNYETSGWNYVRKAMNQSKTAKFATDLRMQSLTVDGALAFMAIYFPPAAPILGAGGVVTTTYFQSLAEWLDYNNSYKGNTCGVVLDINKFTTVYTIWTQPEFAATH